MMGGYNISIMEATLNHVTKSSKKKPRKGIEIHTILI